MLTQAVCALPGCVQLELNYASLELACLHWAENSHIFSCCNHKMLGINPFQLMETNYRNSCKV